MSDDSQRYLVISADAHDGPPMNSGRYRDYLEERYREEFDELVAQESKALGGMMGADGVAPANGAEAGAEDPSNPWKDYVTGLMIKMWGNDPAYVHRAVELYWSEEPPIVDPSARLAEMEAQGVVAEFVNTSAPMFAKGSGVDPETCTAIQDAHLRWTADFCQAADGRIVATLAPDFSDLDAAIASIRWGREHGIFGGVALPGFDGVPLVDPHWEPLWAVLEEVDLPAILHAGAHFATPGKNYGDDPWTVRMILHLEDSFFCKRVFLHLLAAGVFERHPNLHLGLIEQAVASVPGMLEEWDQQYSSHIGGYLHPRLDRAPSEYWYEHVFLGASFLSEHEGHDLPYAVGIDNLCWAGDFPHTEGSWPHMKTAMRRGVGGMPEEDIRKILGLNAAKWWGFDLDKLRPIADRVGPTVAEFSTPLPESDVPTDPTALSFTPYTLRTPVAAGAKVRSAEVNDARFTIVSADGHASPPGAVIRDYFEAKYHPALDDYMKFRTEGQAGFRKFLWGNFSSEKLPYVDPDGAHADGGRWGGVDATARLAAMDHDGIAADLLFPGAEGTGDEAVDGVADTSPAMPFFSPLDTVRSLDERTAGVRAHHRWITDYVANGEGRLGAIAMPGPCVDMDATLEELRWCADHGFLAVQCPFQTLSPEDRVPALQDPYWEPFWAACADLDLTLMIHGGFGMPQGGAESMMKAMDDLMANVKEGETPDFMSTLSKSADAFMVLAAPPRLIPWDLMLAGVFDRYPGLKVTFTEIRANWVPSVVASLDRRFDEGGVELEKRPSEYWADNVWISGSSIRPDEVEMRHEIGLDHLMFGCDYPHPEGTWPNTHVWIRAAFVGCPEADTRRILGENAFGCFRFDRQKVEAAAARIGPRPSEVLGDHEVDPRLIENFDARSGFNKPPEIYADEQLRPLIEDGLAGATFKVPVG